MSDYDYNPDNGQWIARHGASDTVTLDEVPELQAAEKRILALMEDGEWHTADVIRMVAGTDGIPASAGLRRMRSLRPFLRRRGDVIIKRRREGSRLFEYRLQPEV